MPARPEKRLKNQPASDDAAILRRTKMNLSKTDPTQKSNIYHYNDYIVTITAPSTGSFFYVRGISLTGNVFFHFEGENVK